MFCKKKIEILFLNIIYSIILKQISKLNLIKMFSQTMNESVATLSNEHTCYWCPDNWLNRLKQINEDELKFENESLKRLLKNEKNISESLEKKVSELKEEIRLLKGLPQEEVVEEIQDEFPPLTRQYANDFNYYKDQTFAEEFNPEQLAAFDAAFDAALDFIPELNAEELDAEELEAAVSSTPIIRQKSAYPKFVSLFTDSNSADSDFSLEDFKKKNKELFCQETFIRFPQEGEDSNTPLRHETPRRHTFDC